MLGSAAKKINKTETDAVFMEIDGGFNMAYDTQASVEAVHYVILALSYLSMNSCIFYFRFNLACKEGI